MEPVRTDDSQPSRGQREASRAGDAETAVLVQDVSRVFHVGSRFGKRRSLRAVSSVSFGLRRGELLGLVGESGCGKTTLGRIVAGLEVPTSGSVTFVNKGDNEQSASSGRERRGTGRLSNVQAVFQDPQQSLNPRMRVGRSIAEPLRRSYRLPEVRAKVEEALGDVLLERDLADRYPHQLSGGQQQRVAIARAIVSRPDLIVYDEAVSALDSVSQRTVTEAIRSLTRRLGLAGLFISHDMHVVESLCDRIAVMYAGKIVEIRQSDSEHGTDFRHPYSTLLFRSIPIPDPKLERLRPKSVLQGHVPDPLSLPSGCAFAPRCPIAQGVCHEAPPPLVGSAVTNAVACYFEGTLEL